MGKWDIQRERVIGKVTAYRVDSKFKERMKARKRYARLARVGWIRLL